MLPQTTLTAVYAASIVGGIFAIVSAICLGFFIRSRRRNAKRRRLQDELAATAKPRRQIFIQQQIEIPSGMAERFRRKDEYIRTTLGETYPMHTPNDRLVLLPRAHLANRQSFRSVDAVIMQNERNYTPTTISRLSGNKLKMAVDWVKSAPTRTVLPKAGVLKNQASKPNLAPRKLMKFDHQRPPEALLVRPLST